MFLKRKFDKVIKLTYIIIHKSSLLIFTRGGEWNMAKSPVQKNGKKVKVAIKKVVSEEKKKNKKKEGK